MQIKLLENIHGTGRTWCDLPTEYNAGEIITVTPADNLPNDSQIAYWVTQDGWQDDPYGFPVWKSDKFEIVHYCQQCNKEMGPEWILGLTCGKCVRKNHRRACGSK